MKKHFLILLLIMWWQCSNAQNNAIFFGGIGDGLSSLSAAQSYADIRTGGSGDGFTTGNYAQAFIDVNKGGAGDGYSSNTYVQSYTDIRSGGIGDGYISNGYVQIYSDVRAGGIGDGFNSNYYAQAYTDMRTGGIGDGWTAQLAILPLTPLGIEFLSFTGKQIAGADVLDWNTIYEKNVSHFVIEHSTNSTSFIELAKVDAAGNTTTKSNYTFTNSNPLIGNNFYRFKMVDDDSTFVYSNIILLKNTASNNVISVYPNPTATQLFIQIANSTKKSDADICIIDINGKAIYQQHLSTANLLANIDVSAWASGSYFVKIIQGQEVNIIKIIKQ